MSNLKYRIILVVTLVSGFGFIFGCEKLTENPWCIILGIVFIIGVILNSYIFRNFSEEKIYEIIGIDWFKRLGLDIDND